MWTEKYYVFDVDGRKAYVRKDRLSILNRVGGVIFDCDGVLVDIRESYNKAIARTVSYVLKALTNSEVPGGLVSNELIHLFRRTGGFNNDWDTVYGILMFTLSKMPDEKRDALKNLVTKISRNQTPFQRLLSARKATEQAFEKNCLRENFFEETFRSLKEFTRFLDASGTASVDKALAEMTGSNEDFEAFCNILGSFLYLPAEVGKSIIATAQEEFFCGAELFKQTFGVEPAFNKGSGMVENEKIIIQSTSLEKLVSLLGGRKLGIASGSWSKPAKYALGDLVKQFEPEACVFLNDAVEAECHLSEEKGTTVNLRKPNPYTLTRAAEGLGEQGLVLYVGDSMEDAFMARDASKAGREFVFVGVYRYSGLDDVVRDGFLRSGCDIVIPSVNELPSLLEVIRRGRSCA